MSFDWSILYFIQEHIRCSVLDVLMPWITALGDKGILWILLGLGLLCTKKYRRCGAVLLLALLAGALISNVGIKHLVMRSRPCWLDDTVSMLIAIPRDYSFPSGHTQASAIAATVLWHTDRRMGIPAAVLAVLIAFSRLYLFVHFPTDVLAGAAIGIAVGEIAARLGSLVEGRVLPVAGERSDSER